ncbi:MAG TPA: rhodanese-like domain-containing protein [Holophagaceae bacterium]|nr:rhodanese-like domain-containing protein [Holophagaceae bacterium]
MSGFIPVEEAQGLIELGAVVVDVRTLPEWNEGHGPSLFLPLDQLAARLHELPKDKPVLLVCRSGARSGQAANWLRAQGYDAHNLGPWQRSPLVEG